MSNTDSKIEKMMQQHQKLIEQTKPAALKIALGEWAVDSIRNGKPMNHDTLREWAESKNAGKSQRMIILDLLKEITE